MIRWPDHRTIKNFQKFSKFTLIGNVYQKTVPENQLEVNLENECMFLISASTSFTKNISDLYLRYFVSTKEPERRKRETEFDDISLSNKPEIELTCRFRKWVQIISQNCSTYLNQIIRSKWILTFLFRLNEKSILNNYPEWIPFGATYSRRQFQFGLIIGNCG